VKGILARFIARREDRNRTAVLIAKRAVRIGNRKPEAVAAYVAKHTILARGK
jgi:hypothetical protein